MIFGFDYLGFQSIKRFPTKNTIFLPVMQCTITNNSFLLVFYSYVLVFYPYVLMFYPCYWYVSRMCPYVTRMYSFGVLVTINTMDGNNGRSMKDSKKLRFKIALK